MQDPFESELAEADELEAAADAWGDDAYVGEGADDADEGMIDEAAMADDGDEGDDVLDDDGLDEESVQGDGLEDAEATEDGLEAGDAFAASGEDGIDPMSDLGDGVEDADGAEFDTEDSGDELDEAFAESMDASDEDEFARRLTIRLRTIARPFLRRIAARVVPIGLQMIRYAARHGAAPGTGVRRFDAMDLFADAAADEAASGRENDYIAFLAGLAGRYVVRAILSAAQRRMRPSAARALGRAATRAARRAARMLVRRRGPKALRGLPHVVRQVARLARRHPGGARAVPRMIQGAAKRVAASSRATARLSRPSAAVRRLRARASKRMVRSRATAPGLGGRTNGGGTRSIVLRGPVTLVVQRQARHSAWPPRAL
jgi:hypothetical protein